VGVCPLLGWSAQWVACVGGCFFENRKILEFRKFVRFGFGWWAVFPKLEPGNMIDHDVSTLLLLLLLEGMHMQLHPLLTHLLPQPNLSKTNETKAKPTLSDELSLFAEEERGD
jgi:hypothetical protein